MDNKEIVIKAIAENTDKGKGNTDEIKLMQSNDNKCNVIFGKRGTGAVVSLNGNKAEIHIKSKFLWTTGKVEVTDSANNKIEVTKKGSKCTFETQANENYSITVTHKLSILLIILLGLLFVALILGAMRFSTPEIEDKTPFGDFSIGGKQEPVTSEAPETDIPTISYAGYGRYTISEEHPDIEMYNPDSNFVDMRFTVTDDETGDMIARTDLVAPGDYVYVNAANYYAEKLGEHTITINIESFAADGAQMNGMIEHSVIIVK